MSNTQITITCETVAPNEGRNPKEDTLVIGATKVKALNQLIESDKSLIYAYAPGNTPENNYPVIVATSEGNLPDVDFETAMSILPPVSSCVLTATLTTLR